MRHLERFSGKAKKTIAAALVLLLTGIGFAAYKLNDRFSSRPAACARCHGEEKRDWAQSAHRAVPCGECHQFSNKERVVHSFGRETASPGDADAPWQRCRACHWEKNDAYAAAPIVKSSGFHAKHVTAERLACVRCHGSFIHRFLPEERFCIKCHGGRVVHGTGMEKLACINCHSDRTAHFMPDREKCLYCHGDESVRRKLIAEGGLDVKYFQPSPEVIRKAIKIKTAADAPMRFPCYVCHKPHTKIRPGYGTCLSCHKDRLQAGAHALHMTKAGQNCIVCHKPHVWKATKSQGQRPRNAP